MCSTVQYRTAVRTSSVDVRMEAWRDKLDSRCIKRVLLREVDAHLVAQACHGEERTQTDGWHFPALNGRERRTLIARAVTAFYCCRPGHKVVAGRKRGDPWCRVHHQLLQLGRQSVATVRAAASTVRCAQCAASSNANVAQSVRRPTAIHRIDLAHHRRAVKRLYRWRGGSSLVLALCGRFQRGALGGRTWKVDMGANVPLRHRRGRHGVALVGWCSCFVLHGR